MKYTIYWVITSLVSLTQNPNQDRFGRIKNQSPYDSDEVKYNYNYQKTFYNQDSAHTFFNEVSTAPHLIGNLIINQGIDSVNVD